MSNLLESILRVGMTVFIVGPLTAWVARRGARERSEATDSLDCFTVRMPAAGMGTAGDRACLPLLAPLHHARRPAVPGEVDSAVVEKFDTLGFEQLTLRLRSAKGEARSDAAVGKHDAMAGDGAGFRIDVQGVSHVSGSTGLTNELGDLTICGNHAAGHLAYHVVYAVEESVGVPVCHAALTFNRYRHCSQERRPTCAGRLSKEVLREGREGATFVSKVFNSPVPSLS